MVTAFQQVTGRKRPLLLAAISYLDRCVPSVLSAHTWLIAAVLVPYFLLMVTLGVYIYRTGQPRSDDPPDTDEDARRFGKDRTHAR